MDGRPENQMNERKKQKGEIGSNPGKIDIVTDL